jgi:hypothetical protein
MAVQDPLVNLMEKGWTALVADVEVDPTMVHAPTLEHETDVGA